MRGLMQLGAVIGTLACLIAMLGIAGGVEAGAMPFAAGAILSAVVIATEIGIMRYCFGREGDHE